MSPFEKIDSQDLQARVTPIPIKAPWTCGQTWIAGGVGNFFNPPSHNGVDFNKPGGDFQEPFLATAAGTVTISDTGCSGCNRQECEYGKLVKIDHGNGIETRYAHLDSFSVSTGTFVSQGQEIGKCGNTGWSCGPHLHFELRQNGIPMRPDPMDGQAVLDGAQITSSNGCTPCTGKFNIGDRVQVTGTGGIGLRVRANPSTSATSTL